jgi:Zn-dependent M16 (insulinase) family peptidase
LCDGAGFDADNRDTLFVAGLKDVEQAAAGKIEEIIVGVFRDLVKKGIDKNLIDSAIHQLEFHRKEITNTTYPYGIKLLLTFSGSWFHGGDPVKVLNFAVDLAKLQSELAKGAFFENCIQKYFLDNPHRVVLTLVPDPEMEQNETRRVRAELDRIKIGLSQSDIDQIKQDAEALKRLQETEEDVSCLPTLQREDIPPSVPIIKESASEDALRATLYSTTTSGIVYFAAAAGTGLLPAALLPLAPFFCYALSRMGTTRRDYAEMAQRIDAYTGGVGLSTHARTRFDVAGDCVPFISFNGKCLLRNREPMFNIIQELLHHSDFSNLTRLKSILLEYRAGLESMVIQSGHRLAISLAARNLSATRMLSETWSGVHQLQTIKRLSDDITEQDLIALSGELTAIGKGLFTQANFRMALIGEAPALTEARSCAKSIFDGFKPGEEDGFREPDMAIDGGAIREGWSTSSAVSFVALAFETVRMAHEDAAVLAVISKMLRSMYLHREIREKAAPMAVLPYTALKTDCSVSLPTGIPTSCPH